MIATLLALAALAFPQSGARADESPVLLRYRFHPGETLRYRHEKTERRVQDVGPSMESRQETVIRQKTISVGDDGVVGLEMIYEYISLEGRLGSGQSFRFDSRTDAGSADDAQAQVLRAIVGRPFRATIDASGNVLSVAGFDEVIEGVVSDGPGEDRSNPFSAEIVSQMKASMGNESVRQALSQAFRTFSDRPVAPGESWSTVSENRVPLVGTFRVETRHRLAGRDDVPPLSCVVVESAGTISLAPESGSGFAGMLIRHTLEGGTVAARLWFAPERGILARSTMHSETSMRIEFPQKPGDGGRPRGPDYLPQGPIRETSSVDLIMELLPDEAK